MQKIKFLVMDVDGTLTDGKIYMGQNGELFKAFDIKDGAGIFLILPQLNIIPVIITARESQIVANRCKELNIVELHQGVKDKLAMLNSILTRYNADLGSVAYAGDDLPDIPCMEAVSNAGGAVVCPSDAIPEIKVLAEYISGNKAGEGAIRDIINYLSRRTTNNIDEKIALVIDWINNEGYNTNTPLPDGCAYSIQEYFTKPENECVIESHRNHIDIQYMLEGSEEFKLYSEYCLTKESDYNSEKDVDYWQRGVTSSTSVLVKNSIIIVNNNQPHQGAIRYRNTSKVKKLVCKIDITI